MADKKREAYIYCTRDKVRISTPYNADFVTALKEGLSSRRWDQKRKEWIINIEEYDKALEIMNRFYDNVKVAERKKGVQKPRRKQQDKDSYLRPDLEIWIDGACEPINPGGTASYGLVIKGKNETLLREGKVVGSGKGMSNNAAEYSGLVASLEWYKANKRNDKVNIYSDSDLLVKQMTGVYRAKRGSKKGLYYPYYQQAVSLLNDIGRSQFRFEWIPREANTEADELSKEVLCDVVLNEYR